MKHPDRLWLAISGHGHGHLVQVTPLVRALQARYPSLVLTIQSSLPGNLLRQAFGEAMQRQGEAVDFGMAMSGPMTILPEASLAAYQRFHEEWSEHLAMQVALFRDHKPDLVICDIPYLPLAAAKLCGVPGVAVCSLNWADILEHYCTGFAGAEKIVKEIRSHYAAADLFLRPSPAMPMTTLRNTASIGPLISVGESKRSELQQVLQQPEDKRLVLVTLGGISGFVDITLWPSFDDTLFIVPAEWLENTSKPVNSDRYRSIESTGLTFADLFASCDALITKAGYGAFAGAACCALPVLFAERGDWPEEPYLCKWLKRVGRAASIGWTELEGGNFALSLDELLAQPSKPPVEASGAASGLALIEKLFST